MAVEQETATSLLASLNCESVVLSLLLESVGFVWSLVELSEFGLFCDVVDVVEETLDVVVVVGACVVVVVVVGACVVVVVL